jgi:hypothetical protein
LFHGCIDWRKSLSEEKLEFKRQLLVLWNLALAGWVFLAFGGIWFYNQIFAYLFLAFTAALIYLVLRRLGCSSCYYCTACTSGFGRLAGAFFGTGYLKKGSVGNRIGLVGFIYVLLFPVPAALVVLSITSEVSALKVLVLGLLLFVSAYSLSTWATGKPILDSTHQ